ncbi:hypothetical protein PMIN03_002174 [Paraphaeosphaeria minitans]
MPQVISTNKTKIQILAPNVWQDVLQLCVRKSLMEIKRVGKPLQVEGKKHSDQKSSPSSGSCLTCMYKHLELPTHRDSTRSRPCSIYFVEDPHLVLRLQNPHSWPSSTSINIDRLRPSEEEKSHITMAAVPEARGGSRPRHGPSTLVSSWDPDSPKTSPRTVQVSLSEKDAIFTQLAPALWSVKISILSPSRSPVLPSPTKKSFEALEPFLEKRDGEQRCMEAISDSEPEAPERKVTFADGRDNKRAVTEEPFEQAEAAPKEEQRQSKKSSPSTPPRHIDIYNGGRGSPRIYCSAFEPVQDVRKALGHPPVSIGGMAKPGHKEALKAVNAARRKEKRKKRAMQADSAPKVRFADLPDGSKLYIDMHVSSDTPAKPALDRVHLWRPRANAAPLLAGGDYFGWRQRDGQGHLPISLVCPQGTKFTILGMNKSKEDADRTFEAHIEKYWKSKLQEWRKKVGRLQGELRVVVDQAGSKVVAWNVDGTPIMWYFFDLLEVDVAHRAKVKYT